MRFRFLREPGAGVRLLKISFAIVRATSNCSVLCFPPVPERGAALWAGPTESHRSSIEGADGIGMAPLLNFFHIHQVDDLADHAADLGSIFLDDGIVRTAKPEGFDGPLLWLDPVDHAARLGYQKFLCHRVCRSLSAGYGSFRVSPAPAADRTARAWIRPCATPWSSHPRGSAVPPWSPSRR